MHHFDSSTVYSKGSSLAHVDYLSRNPHLCFVDAGNENWLYVEQTDDDDAVSKCLKGGIDKTRYSAKNGILRYIISSPKGTYTKLVNQNVASLAYSESFIMNKVT